MEENVKLWKRRARSYQQSFCNSLADRFYDRVTEEQLFEKVGFALFNAPSEIDNQSKTASYTKSQQNQIEKICEKIKSVQLSEEKLFYVAYIFVVIRLRNKKNEEGIHVLFRVPKIEGGKPMGVGLNPYIENSHIFIDPKPRMYNSWSRYLQKNKLPKCDMCYPKNGIYSVTDGSVDLTFGCSSACDLTNTVLMGLDVSSTILLVGATGVSLASLAVPIAAPALWGATATVLASGSYETARTVYRLHDIKTHGESLGLKNPDSRSAWLNLAGSVVGVASIGGTAIAKAVVASESAVSRAGILTLRLLNISSLAVNGIGVVNNIITLVMKYINGTLEMADVIQFTYVCFFFVNAIVSYNIASRMIEELSSSKDLANLFNLRENASFGPVKDIVEFKDSNTFRFLLQLLRGFQSMYFPNISTEELEAAILAVIGLIMKLQHKKISWNQFGQEVSHIVFKIWKRYEKVILKAIEEIKMTFEISYWQELVPRQTSNNLEIPRKMCEAVDRVIEFCDVTRQSEESKNLMTFARAFSGSQDTQTDEEFINRFNFYCECIIAQFKEEKENYENALDEKSSEPEFVRVDFDKSYGIEGNKNDFFFTNALHKVNHPDFLGNIHDLYENLPRNTSEPDQLPFLQTVKSKMYTFCGPVNQKKLRDEYYWERATRLTGIEVTSRTSTMTRNDNLVLILPNASRRNSQSPEEDSFNELEAIVIQTCFIGNCHMGLLLLILK